MSSPRQILDRIIQFAGGYVRVDDDPEAIYKQPGIGGHLKRNAFTYASLPLALPSLGISTVLGSYVDGVRQSSNMIKAMNQPAGPRTKKNMKVSHRMMKGADGSMALIPMSAREELDMILFAKKGGDYKRHWSQKKTKPKGKPLTKSQQAEEDEQHQMSARDQLSGIIELQRGKYASRLLGRASYERPFLSGHQAKLADLLEDTMRSGVAGNAFLNRSKDPTRAPALMAALIKDSRKAGLDVPNRPDGVLRGMFRKRMESKQAESKSAPLSPFKTPTTDIREVFNRQERRRANRDTLLSSRESLDTILFGVDANGKLHNSKGEFGGDNDAVAHPEAMRATYQRAAGLGATAGAAGVAGGMGMKALVEKLKGLKRK